MKKDSEAQEQLHENMKDTPLIDAHAHPFRLFPLTQEVLLGLLAIGGPTYEAGAGEDAKSQLSDLILYRYLRRKLAEVLGRGKCGNIEELLKARNAALLDAKEYLKLLFDSVNIKGLIIDDGYSEARVEHALPHIQRSEFEALLPPSMKVWYAHRVEPTIKRAFEEADDFKTFESIIMEDVERFSKEPRYVGFKTIIAYRTGLSIEWQGEEEARREFNEYKRGGGEYLWFGPALRVIRNYVTGLLAQECAKRNKVLKLHTGIGDKDIVLKRSSPIELFDFLKREEVRKTKIVLVHGGFPWTAISSYLVNAFPNVFMDLSIATPFGAANLTARIHKALELAPFSKIMYASDGYYVPELHWIGAVAFRHSLEKALSSMLSNGLIIYEEAVEISQKIMSKNAENVFQLRD